MADDTTIGATIATLQAAGLEVTITENARTAHLVLVGPKGGAVQCHPSGTRACRA